MRIRSREIRTRPAQVAWQLIGPLLAGLLVLASTQQPPPATSRTPRLPHAAPRIASGNTETTLPRRLATAALRVPAPSADPLAGALFFRAPQLTAGVPAADARRDAAIFEEPQAVWFTGTTGGTTLTKAIADLAAAAAVGHTVPVLVAYDIPHRDCGGYSAGGAPTESAYLRWVAAFAAGLGHARAVVIVEPDSLADLGCLDPAETAQRYTELSSAVHDLIKDPAVLVYLDGGNARWQSAPTMAGRLVLAGVQRTAGFALNTSNFDTTANEISYGTVISGLTGGSHFVIDSSRNGSGPASPGQWCNPPGRALGSAPTTSTASALLDALLWIKNPGRSDGRCHAGDPAAGQFWQPLASALINDPRRSASG